MAKKSSKWELTIHEDEGDVVEVHLKGPSAKVNDLNMFEVLMRGLRAWDSDVNFQDGKAPKEITRKWFLPLSKVKAKLNPIRGGKAKKSKEKNTRIDLSQFEIPSQNRGIRGPWEPSPWDDDEVIDKSPKGRDGTIAKVVPWGKNREVSEAHRKAIAAVPQMIDELKRLYAMEDQMKKNPKGKTTKKIKRQEEEDFEHAIKLYKEFNGVDPKEMISQEVWLPDNSGGPHSPLVAIGEGTCPFVGYSSGKTNGKGDLDAYIHHFGEDEDGNITMERPRIYVTVPPPGYRPILLIIGGVFDIEDREDPNTGKTLKWLVN